MSTQLGSILIVDDEPLNRQVLRKRLEHRGYHVILAEDGRTAIQCVASEPFDLVLLDVVMPDLDGIQVLRQIRALRSRAQLPVIMVTARDATADIVEALRLGANDYVTKPIDVEVLLARVGTHVVLKRTTESLEETNRRLAEANKQLRGDLDAAARVQQSYLPQLVPHVENFRFAWKYKPCDQLAGDNLNIMSLSENHVGFYVLDVSGHGVRAALLSVAINHLLEPSVDDTSVVNRPNRKRRTKADPRFLVTPPRDVAERLNRRFVFDPGNGQFFTILYAVLDLRERSCQYVSTGHPPPIHLTRDGGMQLLESSGMPIGFLQESHPSYQRYEERTVKLQKGDRLYVYSDGIVESRHQTKGQFGVERLAQLLGGMRDEPVGETVDAVFEAVEMWREDSPLTDDLSLVGVDVL